MMKHYIQQSLQPELTPTNNRPQSLRKSSGVTIPTRDPVQSPLYEGLT